MSSPLSWLWRIRRAQVLNFWKRSRLFMLLSQHRTQKNTEIQGVLPGVSLDNLSGFPTLNNIPHTAELKKDVEINVFGHPPRSPECVIITLDDDYVRQFSDAEVCVCVCLCTRSLLELLPFVPVIREVQAKPHRHNPPSDVLHMFPRPRYLRKLD